MSKTYRELSGDHYYVTVQYCESLGCDEYLGVNYPAIYCTKHKGMSMFHREFMPVLPARFACETHEQPGQCDEDCAALLAGMMGDAHFDGESMIYSDYLGGTSSIDWSRTHEPAPRSYNEVEYDPDNRAVLLVTFVPNPDHY